MSASRIARKPVVVPAGVDIKIDGHTLSAKGPKGNLRMQLNAFVKVTINGNEVHVALNGKKDITVTGPSSKLYRSIAGTVRANIQNIVLGVSKGFERKLALIGVGYRAQAKGKVLSLSLGFSHPTDFQVPEGVTVETPTATEIIIKGADKELVGLVAANVRRVRKPEPYKGKGVRYANEFIELKETKKK